MPALYPMFAELAGRGVLVVGGGSVAARKVRRLLETGARVTVVAPAVCDQVAELARDGALVLHKRTYEEQDLEGVWLVVTATDDEELNRTVSEAAVDRRIFCNVVDQPHLCTFQVPALVRRGMLQVAVSTAGASPALAKRLRRELEERFGPEYAQLLVSLLELRRHYQREYEDDPRRRRELLESFLDSGAPELLLQEDDPDAFFAEVEKWKSR
ncbi:MAG: precorrin-2 dehydrogenase/sirohydrochlorin ferrochelatase family protein [Planctomycetota bacterium]